MFVALADLVAETAVGHQICKALKRANITAFASKGYDVNDAEGVQNMNACAREDLCVFSRKRKRKLKDEIASAEYSGLCACVFIGDGNIAALRKVARHNRDYASVLAEGFSDLA